MMDAKKSTWLRALLRFATSGPLDASATARAEVTEALARRPRLDEESWYRLYWEPEGVPEAVSNYVFHYFGEISGIDSGRAVPTDLMESDLRFNEVCGDWDYDHIEAFARQFKVPRSLVVRGHPRIKDNPSLGDIVRYLGSVVRKAG